MLVDEGRAGRLAIAAFFKSPRLGAFSSVRVNSRKFADQSAFRFSAVSFRVFRVGRPTFGFDFSLQGMSSAELQAVVKAWQANAISQSTMLDLFRRGEILPDGRTDEQERALISAGMTNHE